MIETSPLFYLSNALFFSPAALICVLPLQKHLRFSKKIVYTGFILLDIALTFLVAYSSNIFGINENLLLLIGLLPILLCYIIFYNVYPPILIFIFATAMLTMAFVSGCTDSVLSAFFVGSKSNSLIYLCIQFGFVILFSIPIVFLFLKRISKMVNDYKDRKVWQVLWMIPLTLTSILILFPVTTALHYLYACIFLSAGCIFIYSVIFVMMEQSVLASKLLQENNNKEKQLMIEQAQYNALFSGIEHVRLANHDLRHHFNAIMAYSKSDQPDKLQAYIKQYLSSIQEETLNVYCENPAINKLLSYYQSVAQKQGIKTDFAASVSNSIAIDEPDLWILFGNCLENAIEACCRYADGNKYIKLKVKQKGNTFGITIDNSYQGDIKKDKNNVFISSKAVERTGVGLHSVQIVVDKYQGMLEIKFDGTLFRVSAMLYLSK